MGINANEPEAERRAPTIESQSAEDLIDRVGEASRESFPASDSPAWAMGSEPNASIDEQEIRQLVSTWMAASKAGDVDKVLSLMADDVVFLLPGQPVMYKADFAAAARAQSSQDALQLGLALPPLSDPAPIHCSATPERS
jgi:hypothetical protein